MEKLKAMKCQLVEYAQSKMYNLDDPCVQAGELGEVIDMIKDLEEAIYHCAKIQKMEEEKENEEFRHKMMKNSKEYPLTGMMYPPDEYMYNPDRDMDKDIGRLYYGGNPTVYNTNPSLRGTNPQSYADKDYREGRSGMSRRTYMEGKEKHHDSSTQIKELEHYMKELSQDITEMIEDATPEEKAVLQQKLNTLANKIK